MLKSKKRILLKKFKGLKLYVLNCNKFIFFCAKNLNLLACVRLSEICEI